MAQAAQFGLDVVDSQYLTILTHLIVVLCLFWHLQSQIKSVFNVVQCNEEQHGTLKLLLYLQMVAYLLPVLVDEDSKLPLRNEVYLVAAVGIAETVTICPYWHL